MNLFVLKDGTIPVAILRPVAVDTGADLGRYGEELASGDAHEYLERFTVPDESAYVLVTWDEFMGFTVSGFREIGPALEALNGEATNEAIANSHLDTGHWAVTYGEGDHESYGHVFTLRASPLAV